MIMIQNNTQNIASGEIDVITSLLKQNVICMLNYLLLCVFILSLFMDITVMNYYINRCALHLRQQFIYILYTYIQHTTPLIGSLVAICIGAFEVLPLADMVCLLIIPMTVRL